MKATMATALKDSCNRVLGDYQVSNSLCSHKELTPIFHRIYILLLFENLEHISFNLEFCATTFIDREWHVCILQSKIKTLAKKPTSLKEFASYVESKNAISEGVQARLLARLQAIQKQSYQRFSTQLLNFCGFSHYFDNILSWAEARCCFLYSGWDLQASCAGSSIVPYAAVAEWLRPFPLNFGLFLAVRC